MEKQDLLNKLLSLEKEKKIEEIQQYFNNSEYNDNPAMLYYKAHCYYVGFIFDKDLVKSVNLLRESANKNYASACYVLSTLLEKGEGIDRDLETANEYLSRASNLGYLPAMNHLGEVFLDGRLNYAKDEATAVDLFKAAACKKYRKAAVNYAHCLYNGIGCETNRDEAMRILESYANAGYCEAEYELGLIYYHGVGLERDSIKCTYHLLKGAEGGSDRAMKLLGDCYYDGYGVNVDHKLAFKYYRLAADKGNVEACEQASHCLIAGDGVQSSYKAAINYLVKAAVAGDSDAQVSLGNRYFYGDGFRQSLSRAAYWYKQAAKANNPTALKSYGDMLEEGKGIKRDVKKAIEMYTLAVDLGNYDACAPLADIYNRGRKGIKRDYSLALMYYEIAYRNIDDPNSAFEYAELLSHGKGVAVADYSKASKAYEFAADNGSLPAIKIIGEYYLKGIGVNKDYEKALRYYLEAAKQGDEESEILVSLIRRNIEFKE